MSLVFLVDLYTAGFFLLMSFSFFFKLLHVTSLAGDRLECLSLEGTGHFISFECSFSCLKGSIFLLAWLYHLSLHLQASAFPSPSTSLYLITCQVVILTRSGCKFFFFKYGLIFSSVLKLRYDSITCPLSFPSPNLPVSTLPFLLSQIHTYFSFVNFTHSCIWTNT